MTSQRPALPTPDDMIQLGVHIGEEIHSGEQSRVFRATVDGDDAVVKLTDRRLTDAGVLAERLLVTEVIADETPTVVPPLRIEGELLHTSGDWCVSATPFIDGEGPDITNADDAQLMGRTLAQLHEVLSLAPASAVPPVAALDLTSDADREGWQLLHGDFSQKNTISTVSCLRIFDFDDCGRGPVIYDVANSLYMVLFDAEVSGRPDRYSTFRPAFLEGYNETARVDVDDEAVNSMIDTRIWALGRWLDDLENAPIGIRTASPQWHRTLREFVAEHGVVPPMLDPRPS